MPHAPKEVPRLSDSMLPPDQDDVVRALLADARHTEPVPADVVARLDAELASLAAERRSTERLELAPVVTLASRRRRTAATALLAAAAVVVFGVGISQVLPSTDSGGDSSAGSTADESTMSRVDGADSAAPESDRAFGAESEAPADKELNAGEQARESAPLATNPVPPVLSSDAPDLKSQVRKLQRGSPYSSYATDPACVPDEAASGLEVGVTYDDQPAVLVFRDLGAGDQRVDIFICGEPDPTRSLTLRAR